MATDADKDQLKREMPSWVASIAFHAAVLLVLWMIPYLAVRWADRSAEAPISLSAPAGSAVDGVDDPGGASGGNVDRPRPIRPAAGYAEVPSVAAPAATAIRRLDADLRAPELRRESLAGSADPAAALTRELAEISKTADFKGGGGLAALLTGTSAGFGKHIGDLRGKGLDVVVVLDATNSMAPYINQAKRRLHEILNVVTGLVPNARLGVVAYKDYGDDYGPQAVRIRKISPDAKAVRTFIDNVVAGGGGDEPEPINEALAAATSFRTLGWGRGRKWVIILVGDSSIHASGRSRAFELARNFAGRSKGTINVIDVGGTGAQGVARNTIQPDLKRIAEHGKGSAFFLKDEKLFWRYLIVSVFGKRFEQDVDVIIRKFVREEK